MNICRCKQVKEGDMHSVHGVTQKQDSRSRVISIILTISTCALLLVVSWLLCIWFDKIRADESVVFGSLLAMCAVMLAVVFIDWRHHHSIWISLFQGFFISAFAAFPIFRGEPDLEPMIGPAAIGIFGGALAAIAAGLRARRIRVWHLCGLGGVLSTISCLIAGVTWIKESTRPVPRYDNFLFQVMAANDSAERIKEAAIATIVCATFAVTLTVVASMLRRRVKPITSGENAEH